MDKFIPMEHGDQETIWIEVEVDETQKGIKLRSGGQDQLPNEASNSFAGALQVLKKNAQLALETIEEIGPNEVELSFGIKAGVEGGVQFFGLAKASTDAHYTVTMKWTKEQSGK